MDKPISFSVTKEYEGIVIDNKTTECVEISLISNPKKPNMIIPPGTFSISEDTELMVRFINKKKE